MPSELYKHNEIKIGDDAVLADSAESDREGIFIYLQGKIFTSFGEFEAHSALLKKILKDKNTIDTLKKIRLYHLSEDEDKVKTNLAVSFGHIVKGNIAIIDPISTRNVANTKVKEVLISDGFSKVYIGSKNNGLLLTDITRLAKKI